MGKGGEEREGKTLTPLLNYLLKWRHCSVR